ncbi:DnaJ-domain-containing protein [Acephala macrosclerotiorum]|nr:DnaJ-domain-containing protein [Acephala macrosclerotiorum]
MWSSKYTDMYDVLQVPRNCDVEQVKVAYKKLALARHPDKNLDNPNATAQFQLLVNAVEILSDKYKRSTYNFEWDRRNAQYTAFSSFKTSTSKTFSFKPQTSKSYPFEAHKSRSSSQSTYNASSYTTYKTYTSWTPPSLLLHPITTIVLPQSGQHGLAREELRMVKSWEFAWIESLNHWIPTVPHHDARSRAKAEPQPSPRPKTPLRPQAAPFKPRTQSPKPTNEFEGLEKTGGFFQQRFPNGVSFSKDDLEWYTEAKSKAKAEKNKKNRAPE